MSNFVVVSFGCCGVYLSSATCVQWLVFIIYFLLPLVHTLLCSITAILVQSRPAISSWQWFNIASYFPCPSPNILIDLFCDNCLLYCALIKNLVKAMTVLITYCKAPPCCNFLLTSCGLRCNSLCAQRDQKELLCPREWTFWHFIYNASVTFIFAFFTMQLLHVFSGGSDF